MVTTLGTQACFESDELVAMTAIFEAEVHIAVLRRAPDAAIVGYLEALHARGDLRTGFRSMITPGEPFVLRGWADDEDTLAGRAALITDVQMLATAYADLMGCTQVGLRFEVVDRAMCPRFHVDRTGVRLLCTYRGPGTQWLAHKYANRQFLGAGAQGVADDCSGLIRAGGEVRVVPPFSVALLKGEAWPDHAGRGLIHRSPAVPPDAGPRVILALDAIW